MLDYCKTCFHVEFCVQDAKQFTELTDCQSRDLDKLYFHFNTTLTSGNLAKTEAFEKGVVFSMATVKVLFHNIFSCNDESFDLIKSYRKKRLDFIVI